MPRTRTIDSKPTARRGTTLESRRNLPLFALRKQSEPVREKFKLFINDRGNSLFFSAGKDGEGKAGGSSASAKRSSS